MGYLICSVERSGSTLLCDLLQTTGVAGRPLVEPFNTRVEADAFKQHGFDDFTAYLQFATQRSRTDNGVCGINLMWRHLARVDALTRRATGGSSDFFVSMSDYMQGIDYALLTVRRDTIGQAISWALA